MYKDDYISAFGKLAPSEEWMADTLAKMRAAEAEQEAPGAAAQVDVAHPPPRQRVGDAVRRPLHARPPFCKSI